VTDAEEALLKQLEQEEADLRSGKQVSSAETFGNSYADTALFGFGDEAGAGLQAGLAAVTPGMDAGETYRSALEDNRRSSRVGPKQNKWSSRLGTGLGVAASMITPLKVAKFGSGLLGRLGSGMATGAGYSALASLGRSDADLTKGEFGKALMDMLGAKELKRAAAEAEQGNYGRAALNVASAGAPGGMLTGGALAGVLEGARHPAIVAALAKLGINQGRKVLTNGADQLSTREPVRDAAVREAIESGAIQTGGTTQGALQRLERLSDEQGAVYGEIVKGLETQGVKGPEARKIADELLEQARTEWANTGANKSTTNMLMDEGANAEAVANQGRLSLTQAENIKRRLQKEAKYGRVEETVQNETKRGIASTFRQAVEDVIEQAGQAAGEGSQIRALADKFVPTKQKLGNLLEAEAAATRGNARVAQRQSGHIPGPIETTVALGAGQPQLLLAKPVLNALKSRGTSTVASGALRLSNALKDGRAAPIASRYAERLHGVHVPPEELALPVAAEREDGDNDRPLVRAMKKRRQQR
jgi:uncharacterized membrane protein